MTEKFFWGTLIICALVAAALALWIAPGDGKSATQANYRNTVQMAVWEQSNVSVGACEQVSIFVRVRPLPGSTVPGQIGLPWGTRPCWNTNSYTVSMVSKKWPATSVETYDVARTTDWLNRPYELYFLFDPYTDGSQLHVFRLSVVKTAACIRPTYTLNEQDALRQVVCNYLP